MLDSRPPRFLALALSLALAVTILTTASLVLAERDTLPLLDYRTESWFLPQSPGVTAGPVGLRVRG